MEITKEVSRTVKKMLIGEHLLRRYMGCLT
jgi:hypothetical protein